MATARRRRLSRSASPAPGAFFRVRAVGIEPIELGFGEFAMNLAEDAARSRRFVAAPAAPRARVTPERNAACQPRAQPLLPRPHSRMVQLVSAACRAGWRHRLD